MFLYKCKQEIEGYALRRREWLEINEEHPEMMHDLKAKVFQKYEKEIRTPLLQYKDKDMGKIRKRSDISTIIAIKETGQQEMERIQKVLEFQDIDTEGDKSNINRRIEQLEGLLYKVLKLWAQDKKLMKLGSTVQLDSSGRLVQSRLRNTNSDLHSKVPKEIEVINPATFEDSEQSSQGKKIIRSPFEASDKIPRTPRN